MSQIINIILKFIEKSGRMPTRRECRSIDGLAESELYKMGGLGTISNNPKIKHALSRDKDEQSKKLKNAKTLLITSSIVGDEIDQNFFKSIQKFNSVKKAKHFTIPVFHTKRKTKLGLPKELLKLNEVITDGDVKINNNIHISGIRVNAKQTDPLVGLDRLANDGSLILGSPKQFFRFCSTKKDHPHALISTGSLTKPNYIKNETGIRDEYLAAHDHSMGAVVVEVVSPELYHFRQVSANEAGEFVDLGMKYSGNSVSHSEMVALILGDWHSGETSEVAKTATKYMIQEFKPKNVVIHDLLDGIAINHWNMKKKISRAVLKKLGKTDLLKELKRVVFDLEQIHSWNRDSKINIILSNHDLFLDRWLEAGEWINDEENFRLACQLSIWKYDGNSPLEMFIKSNISTSLLKHLFFIYENDTLTFEGIDCSSHGHNAGNGVKGSKLALEKSLGNAATGHLHSAFKFRNLKGVGTLSNKRLGYNNGPSNWVWSNLGIFKGGFSQHLHIINGKYKA